jgi:hypothetical protein
MVVQQLQLLQVPILYPASMYVDRSSRAATNPATKKMIARLHTFEVRAVDTGDNKDPTHVRLHPYNIHQDIEEAASDLASEQCSPVNEVNPIYE